MHLLLCCVARNGPLMVRSGEHSVCVAYGIGVEADQVAVVVHSVYERRADPVRVVH
jgi:hypothetical protein